MTRTVIRTLAPRTSRIRRVSRSVFLGTIIFLSTTFVAAQPTTTVGPVAVQGTIYDIARQQSVVLRTSDDITSISVADPAVCSVVRDPNDPRHAMLVGGKHGDTHITMWFARPDQEPMTFPVHVRLDSAQLTALETSLNNDFPGSTIHLRSVPLTGKVMLTGHVQTKVDAKSIEASILGGGISEQGLVNRLVTEPDLLAIQNFLNGKFPQAHITLTLVPVSRKILLEGQVATQFQVDEIVKLVVGDEIGQDRLVNALIVCCYSGGCCVTRHRRW